MGRFRVAPVSRTLMSLSQMVEQGIKVVFDSTAGKDSSHMVIKKCGVKIPLVKKNKVCVLPWHVTGTSDFSRRSQDLYARMEGACAPWPTVRANARLAKKLGRKRLKHLQCVPRRSLQRLEHLPLHEPYRSWCATCVAGRAVSDRHIFQPPLEGALAIVGLDCGYLAPRCEPEERCTPIFFGKDSRHKWFYAIPMPSKGITEPWCAQAVASSVSRSGFGRLSFRNDTEQAIVALKRAAGHILTTKFGTEIVPEEASMGDSSSNGLAEHAVREVKAKARSLAHGLKRLLGQELEPTHPVVTWVVDPVGGDDNQYRAPRD